MIHEEGSFEQLKDNLMQLPALVCTNCGAGNLYPSPEQPRVVCVCGWVWSGHDGVWRQQFIGNFSKWVFPVIANMLPGDIIDELVGVQPMGEPNRNGDVFTLDVVVGAVQRALGVPRHLLVVGTETGRMAARTPNIQERDRP